MNTNTNTNTHITTTTTTVLDKVVSPDIINNTLYTVITSVISRLLVLGLGDDEPEIRLTVFENLVSVGVV